MAERLRVAVAGLSVEVRFENDAPVALVADLLGRELVSVDDPPAVVVEIAVGVPDWPERAPDAVAGAMRAWWDDDAVHVSTADVCASVTGERALIVGPRDRLAPSLPPLRHHVLSRLLAPAGVWTIHGAAATNNGTALLVLGTSGTGKSTVSLAALAAGWVAHADDLVLLRIGPGARPEVATVGLDLHVPADLDDGSTRPALEGDRRGRAVVPVPALEWRALTDVAIVTHGSEPCTGCEPASRADVLHALLESFAALRDTATRPAFLRDASVVVDLPGWHLHLGTDTALRLTSTMDALWRISAR